MKKILIGFLLFFDIFCFSQKVKELEHELSFYKSGEEWGNKKNIAFQLLEIDSLNSRAVNYLVEVYSRNNQKDSIQILFEKLIQGNPQSPIPFILRAGERNARFARLSNTQRIKYLKEAFKLDSSNVEVIYTLGKMYYELFIDEFKTMSKNAADLNDPDSPMMTVNLDNYSSSAIQFFRLLCKQNEEYKEMLKFPLIQLANYNGDKNLNHEFENYHFQWYYFPIDAFVDLPEDWRTNYTVNVIDFASDSVFKVSGVESAYYSVKGYILFLSAFEEPILIDTVSGTVFRFTWLRSFHSPVVIRLENRDDSITLYWKVSDGLGGYEPGKIKTNKSKQLTKKQWDEFVAKINAIDFWNLPSTNSGLLGTDGAEWVLEGKEPGKYQVVERWSGGAIGNVCLKLLELTDLKIEEEDVY